MFIIAVQYLYATKVRNKMTNPNKSIQTNRTVLADNVIETVRASVRIRTEIAAALGVNPRTVDKWSVNNDPQLCLPDSMDVIRRNITLRGDGGFTQKLSISEPHHIVD